jgi:hypothetical protein
MVQTNKHYVKIDLISKVKKILAMQFLISVILSLSTTRKNFRNKRLHFLFLLLDRRKLLIFCERSKLYKNRFKCNQYDLRRRWHGLVGCVLPYRAKGRIFKSPYKQAFLSKNLLEHGKIQINNQRQYRSHHSGLLSTC